MDELYWEHAIIGLKPRRTKEESKSVLLGITQIDWPVPEEEGRDGDDSDIRARRRRVFSMIGRVGLVTVELRL